MLNDGSSTVSDNRDGPGACVGSARSALRGFLAAGAKFVGCRSRRSPRHALAGARRASAVPLFFSACTRSRTLTRFMTRRLDGAREDCMRAHKRLTSLAAVAAIFDLKIWTVAPLGLRPEVPDLSPPPLANAACGVLLLRDSSLSLVRSFLSVKACLRVGKPPHLPSGKYPVRLASQEGRRTAS